MKSIPIKGIINGYYRTGTSIIWWILQQSNPEVVILYEPHSVGLHNDFKNLKPDADTLNPLHGMPIYKPYFMIQKDIREEFFRRAKPKSVYTKKEFQDAVETVEMFDRIDKREVIVQSNQLHLILHDFAEYFGCKYIHIIRDPAEVLYSHAESPSKVRQKIQQLLVTLSPSYMISKWVDWGARGKFELKCAMQVARKLGWINGGDWLEKFLRMYVNYNYHVLENLDERRGCIVRFEDLVEYPKFFSRIFWKYLRLKVDPTHNKLNPRKAFQAPDRLKRAVEMRLMGDLRRKWDAILEVVCCEV